MDIKIVREAITKAELHEMAKEQFGDMVKAVVDVDQRFMAIGGGLHPDEEAILLDQGSARKTSERCGLFASVVTSLVRRDTGQRDAQARHPAAFENRARSLPASLTRA